MRFAVEAWAPEYGVPTDADAMQPSDAAVNLEVEVPVARWAPRRPADGTAAPDKTLFVDGVRRIDARVWIAGDDGQARLGICASYAAGVVRCDGRAAVCGIEVQRGLFSAGAPEPIRTSLGEYAPRAAAGETPEQLTLAVQQRMGELEVRVAQQAEAADLVVVDGPLSGRQNVAGAIGYVKTHHVRYLPEDLQGVLYALAAGERTPLFVMTTSWSRYSWYLRLPGAEGHGWAGIVRCEAGADLSPSDAASLADRAAAALPRYASRSHKDPRAPQNLYPIAGLERELRRRLGDPALLYRALRARARRAERSAGAPGGTPLAPPV